MTAEPFGQASAVRCIKHHRHVKQTELQQTTQAAADTISYSVGLQAHRLADAPVHRAVSLCEAASRASFGRGKAAAAGTAYFLSVSEESNA